MLPFIGLPAQTDLEMDMLALLTWATSKIGIEVSASPFGEFSRLNTTSSSTLIALYSGVAKRYKGHSTGGEIFQSLYQSTTTPRP